MQLALSMLREFVLTEISWSKVALVLFKAANERSERGKEEGWSRQEGEGGELKSLEYNYS